jgi:small subunit ribosomal protein S1
MDQEKFVAEEAAAAVEAVKEAETAAAEAAQKVEEAVAETVTEAEAAVETAAAEVKEAAEKAPAEAEESMADYAAELEASLKKGPPTDDPVWARFEELLASREPIEVTIDSAVKGGVVTFVDNVRGFIPASKLANCYVENLEEYKGKTVNAVVITADKAGKKLVLSVRAALKKEEAAKKAAAMAECVEGAVMEGTVDSVMDYGVFVKLDNGVSGLLHVSEISWTRVNSPADVFTKGDRVTVKIKGVKDGKISLSKKALEEAPERPERRPRREGEEGGRPERRDRRPRREGEEGGRPERRERREREEVFNYKETGKASTSVGDLLKGLKLD